MADGVNRVWLSIDLGNFNVGRKASFFAGGDNFTVVYQHLVDAFGSGGADQIIGHLSQLTMEDAFDNLKSGGMVSGDDKPAANTNTDGPICKHGPKLRKTGMGKNGKQWDAWMCPAPKGQPDQCPPEWI